MKIYTDSNYNYVTIVEIEKDEISMIDMDLCSQPSQTLSKYYDACEVKPAIICNAGFFAMSTGATCFTYKDDGSVISLNTDFVEGMGILNGELTFGNLNEKEFTDFVSAYPVLIRDGKKTDTSVASSLNYNARRTVLAYDDTKIYIIAIEAPGMAFGKMQTMLQNMKVTYAINLDGGGSTKILHNGKSITSALYNRAVDNVLAVYLKPKTIYRVQVGAFSSQINANSLCSEIKGIEDTINAGYASAYVRKIGSYYKVQVGAFSKKDGAVKVLNDLKSKGYSAFITTM